jgi:hypothetical protein
MVGSTDLKTFTTQAAKEACAIGYGTASYWRYLEESALCHAAYFRKHGNHEMADKQISQSLSESLMGNDGL